MVSQRSAYTRQHSLPGVCVIGCGCVYFSPGVPCGCTMWPSSCWHWPCYLCSACSAQDSGSNLFYQVMFWAFACCLSFDALLWRAVCGVRTLRWHWMAVKVAGRMVCCTPCPACTCSIATGGSSPWNGCCSSGGRSQQCKLPWLPCFAIGGRALQKATRALHRPQAYTSLHISHGCTPLTPASTRFLGIMQPRI